MSRRGWLCAPLAAACLIASGLPARGAGPAYAVAPAEACLRAFLASNAVGVASFAVSARGRLLCARAYGFADPARTRPVASNVVLRVASVTKPVTAAAVRQLAAEGRLALAAGVLTRLAPPAYPVPADARWQAVTVSNLLAHTGGWDREQAGDPMFMQDRVAAWCGRPAVRDRDVVRWMLGQPLQFAPGARRVYSNFGYCVLGVLLEEITRTNYLAFVNATVAARAGCRFRLSATDPARRDPLEAWYDFGREGERFRIEIMPAHGGLVCAAADLCRFMDAYWLDGTPRPAGAAGRAYGFNGSLPGCTAVVRQRPDGLNFAVLLNKRDPARPWHESLGNALSRCLPAPAGP